MGDGERLRAIRQLAYLSLDQAGALLGIHGGHLSRLERGERTVRPDFMRRAEEKLVPLALRKARVLVEEVAVTA